MTASIDSLKARCKAAFTVKSHYDDLLRDVYEYFLPQRNLYYTDNATQGQKKVDRVFDSTSVSSAMKFANRMQTDMMPIGQRWFKLAPGPLVPKNQREGMQKALDDINDLLYAVIGASNFDTSNNELLLDLGVGTGSMIVNPGPVGVHVSYDVVPLANIALDEGPHGSVDGKFRKHKIAIRNVEGTWPKAKLSDELSKLKMDKPDHEVTMMETYRYDIKSDNWVYEVYWDDAKQDNPVILSESHNSNRWLTPRWMKVSGEVFGRGPFIQALPDVKTLNKMVEYVLKNAAIHISGLWTGVDDGVFNPNTVQIRPGIVIPVASNGGSRGPSMMALDRPGSFDLAAMEMDKLTGHIKEMLFDNRLPPESGAVRSATEIIQRIKELAADVGSPFGRLKTEYIQPLIQATLDVLDEQGLLPGKVKIDGLGVETQLLSPLAQEQNLSDVETVVHWLSVMHSFGPENMLLSAVVEEVFSWLGNKLGVPSELIRSKEQRKQLEDTAAQLAQQQLGQAQQPVGVSAPQGGLPELSNAA